MRKAPRCRELLNKAERREISLHITELVIAEVVWVLQSKPYVLSPTQIRDLLMPVTELPGLELANKALYPKVFALYVEKGIDYIDAYNAVAMGKSGINEIYSYDRDFDGIAGITRLEP